ncbi:hypothetical protein [Ideonella sp. A 288]|uniref:hypothetical protein n=1 Tax=Ideonella sp. A 288 TaxID=1962181 RepID=UPI0011863D48|nr:hypothetical protein [Ideonella sp. A 288]
MNAAQATGLRPRLDIAVQPGADLAQRRPPAHPRATGRCRQSPAIPDTLAEAPRHLGRVTREA